MGYYTEVSADSPIEFWKMDETSGTSVASAGSGAHAGTASNTSIVAGKHINARSFNGTSSYISVGSVADFTAQTNYSVEAWFKISSTDTSGTDWRTIWRRDGSGAFLVRVGGSTSGIQQGAVQAYLNGRTISTGSTRFDDDAWHHVVVTKASSTTKLYVDNVEYTTASGTLGGAVGTSQSLYIGSNNGATGEFFKGSLDSVAVYHSALSSTRIGVHYSTAEVVNAGYTAEPLIAAADAVNPAVTGNFQTLAITNDRSADLSGASTTVNIGNWSTGNVAAFKSDSPAYWPTGEVVSSAKLRVYVDSVSGSPTTVPMYVLTASWTESTDPSGTSKTFVRNVDISSATVGQWLDIDITSIVDAWRTGTTNYGIAFDSTTSSGITVRSSEHATTSTRPVITVTTGPTQSASYTAQVMTASGLMPEPDVDTTSGASVGAGVMTASAFMGDASGGVTSNITWTAEPMYASVDVPGGAFAVTANVSAEALEATAETVAPSAGTTQGAVVLATPLEATARLKQPALVNDEPIRMNEADDRYFQRVYAASPRTWLRLNDLSGGAVDRMGGSTAGYAGVQLGNYDAPDGRHSVYFDGDAWIEQTEPSGDEVLNIGTGLVRSTLEFSFRTSKANEFLWAGRDTTAGTAGSTARAAREMYLRNGRIAFRTHYLNDPVYGQPSPWEFVGFKNLADDEWHHIIVRSTESSTDGGGVEIFVDGKLEIRRYAAGIVVGFPDWIGSRPASIDGINIGSLPSSQNFVGDMTEFAFYPYTLNDDQIPRHYYDFMGWNPIEASPVEAFAFMTAGNSGRGNQKRALYLWWDNTVDAYSVGGDGFNNKMNFDPVLGGHGNFGSYNLEGYKVFSRSINQASPGIPFRDVVTDRQSLINLETDIDIDDYDVIMFGDWPDEGAEIDQWEALYPGQRERLISQLRWANNQGVGLLVTHPRLAVDLGIVDRIEFVPTGRETAATRGQGAASGLYDYGSAVKFPWNISATSGLEGTATLGSSFNGQTQITDPSFLRNKAFFYGDTNKNDKFRVRALIDGLTNIPSYMINDAVYQRDYDAWGWSAVAFKYLHRLDGLRIGDEFFIHGSDFGMTVNDAGGVGGSMDKIRAGRWFGYYATPLANVKAGTVVTTFGATQWVGQSEVDNPYKDYATTIVLQPGDQLAGQPVGGKIFVNFTEQPNMFESSVAVQELPASNADFPNTYHPDTPAQKEWEWSETRKTLSTTGNPTTQTTVNVTMPDGSTMQISTSSSQMQMTRSANIFPIKWYPRWDMTRRGLWWLQQSVEVNEGDKTVVAGTINATVTAPDATVVAQRSVSNKADAMPALAQMPKVAEDTTGDVEVRTLPATANATFTGYSRTISAAPMTAEAELVENFDMVHASGEQVVLTLYGLDRVTLYIKEEA